MEAKTAGPPQAVWVLGFAPHARGARAGAGGRFISLPDRGPPGRLLDVTLTLACLLTWAVLSATNVRQLGPRLPPVWDSHLKPCAHIPCTAQLASVCPVQRGQGERPGGGCAESVGALLSHLARSQGTETQWRVLLQSVSRGPAPGRGVPKGLQK